MKATPGKRRPSFATLTCIHGPAIVSKLIFQGKGKFHCSIPQHRHQPSNAVTACHCSWRLDETWNGPAEMKKALWKLSTGLLIKAGAETNTGTFSGTGIYA
ncbi:MULTISPECIES: hypothetical protein [unclassified Pseudomonas]|uniref:hypothetical protein n=1 Tax=unclassified Pseudomonas TaxID=196821 RepID=UPI001B3399DE|nr:hypothetical protein [Pseudomonas sp. Tri1]